MDEVKSEIENPKSERQIPAGEKQGMRDEEKSKIENPKSERQIPAGLREAQSALQ
jgi:hypothetical protein